MSDPLDANNSIDKRIQWRWIEYLKDSGLEHLNEDARTAFFAGFCAGVIDTLQCNNEGHLDWLREQMIAFLKRSIDVKDMN